jgi:hypothetical protein
MLKQIMTSLALCLFLTLTVSLVHAQADEKKFEIGGQFSTLSTQTRTVSGLTISEDRKQVQGFGGRFGYNVTENIAVEAELNFFPRDRDIEGGRKFQGLFGVKAGQRFDKVGVFGKARPGFIRFERGDYVPVGGCIAIFPPPIGCFQPEAKTNLALDVGGVVEIYPSQNTLIRLDVGDTIIRFDDRRVAAFQASPFLPPSGLVVVGVGSETKHNFQASVGVGFRF